MHCRTSTLKRVLIRSMLAVAVLLFGGTSASAWSFDLLIRSDVNQPGGVQTASSLTSSVTFIVDVFFTSDPVPSGLQSFSVGVLYDQGGLLYDGVASTALPVVYPASPVGYGTTGNQTAYIMYNAGGGMSPATVLYPIQTPHANWNGINQPGKLQVNLDFADPALNQNTGAATNVWIASLVFLVLPGYAGGTIDLTMNAAQGNLIFANNDTTLGSTVILGGPLTLNVPEPTTAALIGLGILGLALAGRRK